MSEGGSGFAGLRRAQEIVTVRQQHDDGLITYGEFLSSVARVMLEVGDAGLVELLASQAALTSLAVSTLVGDERVAEALRNVALIVASAEEASQP